MPLTRRDLDGMRCQFPGCDHTSLNCSAKSAEPFYLHSRCHVSSPTWAIYQNGSLWITCSQCGDVVAVIQVAESPNPPRGQ